MAKNWIIELVAENTDREVTKAGKALFVSPACGVCGDKERNEDLIKLYKAMEIHKCHAYPEAVSFFEEA